MYPRLRYDVRLGKTSLVGILLAMSGSACDGGIDPGPILARGTLEAELLGSREWSHRGTGSFYTGLFEDGRPQFSFRSEGLDGSEGSSFHFHAVLPDVPPVGTYQIVPQEREMPSEGLFIASYYWLLTPDQRESATPGSTVGEGYIARSGSLNITFASESWIEGEFRLEVVLFCSTIKLQVGDTSAGPCVPWEVEDGAPTVAVNGTFSLVPDDSEVEQVGG